jgi:hypothetical protein
MVIALQWNEVVQHRDAPGQQGTTKPSIRDDAATEPAACHKDTSTVQLKCLNRREVVFERVQRLVPTQLLKDHNKRPEPEGQLATLGAPYNEPCGITVLAETCYRSNNDPMPW